MNDGLLCIHSDQTASFLRFPLRYSDLNGSKLKVLMKKDVHKARPPTRKPKHQNYFTIIFIVFFFIRYPSVFISY